MKTVVSTLDSIVRARGLAYSRINSTEDLLLPPSGKEKDLSAYRALLDHYAARLLIREIIHAEKKDKWLKGRRQVERFCEPEAVDGFLQRFEDVGVVSLKQADFPRPIKSVHSFGPTYEWYVSRVLLEDFSCDSAWGVTFENTLSGGDHDVIASLSGLFLYLEVKTSPPGRIEMPEISGFVRRLGDVAPEIAVFNNDTQLRMKDKIVPMMEEAIYKSRVKSPESREGTDQFERIEREIFHLSSSLYIMNSKPDLKRNLEVVFRHYFRSKSNVLKATT